MNIDNEQILRENSIHQIDFKSSEIEVDAQPTKGTGQDRIIPPILNVWPQRGMSAFSILRQRASNNFAGEDATLSVIEEPMLESTIFEEEILAEESSIDSAIFEDRRNYENKYNLAIEFAEEYGVNALEQGIVELVKDQDDPDYDFTEDEKDMLRAFQDAFWNSRAQSQ